MQSGIYWGYVGLIEGIIERIREDLGRHLKVVATGGLAHLFQHGTDVIEFQPDLIAQGTKVVLVDDLLATVGTMAAAENLMAQSQIIVVANAVLIELEGLGGRDKLHAPLEALLELPA